MKLTRASKRFSSAFPIFFYSKYKKRLGTMHNFSSTGFFIECNTLEEIHSSLTLNLDHLEKKISIQCKVERLQYGYNLKQQKSQKRGIGLSIIGNHSYIDYLKKINPKKNDFDIKTFSSQHIITYPKQSQVIDLFHTQLSKQNITFLHEKKLINDTQIKLIIRSKNQLDSLNILAKVTKCIKKSRSNFFYIYCEISADQYNLIKEHVKQILNNTYISRKKSPPVKGNTLHHPVSELFLIALENRFSGYLSLQEKNLPPVAQIYFKEGQLLHIKTKSIQRFIKNLLKKSNIKFNKEQINIFLKSFTDSQELRDHLIRNNQLSSEIMYPIWREHTLQSASMLCKSFSYQFEFIKNLPKEVVALNQSIDFRQNIFNQFLSYNDIILDHFSSLNIESQFIVHKQKMFLWPPEILQKAHHIDEYTIYTINSLTRQLNINHKECKALVTYFNLINELISIKPIELNSTI